ncbi:MAG: hypothetical protein ACQEP7_02615, partial [bacterium]
MSGDFLRTVDRIQFFGLILAVVTVPVVFFIGPQNFILYRILRLVFPRELLEHGNQEIVLLKPLLAQLIIYFMFILWLIEAVENTDWPNHFVEKMPRPTDLCCQ